MPVFFEKYYIDIVAIMKWDEKKSEKIFCGIWEKTYFCKRNH